MNPIKICSVEKYALLDQPFKFDFPVEYTEYQNLTVDEFKHNVHNQNVIIVCDLDIDEIILENNPDLKLVALCSTGYNHINVQLLKERGIKVCNIRGQATDAVAEHAFTLMLSLIKNFQQQVNAVSNGAWVKTQKAFYLAAPMRELKGKTLVILGKGTIGHSFAEKAKVFGMKVIFSEHRHALFCREGYMPFDEAIKQADVLSLHCVLNNETQEVIDSDVFKMMKPDSLLINVGRGALINEKDLAEAIQTNKIGGYGADVLSSEPPSEDNPLLQLEHPNVIITGHIAWATEEAQQRLFLILQDNINKNLQEVEQNLI